MNLVLNAAEAAEGSQRPTVRVQAGRVEPEQCEDLGFQADSAGCYASLVVTDNGCGMDEETRHRIFEPFFTTKFAGRGLGLAAVSGILRTHHGQIRVESKPGEGTRMTALLPVADVEADEDGSAPPVAERGSGTILVVDDEAAVRNFARTCLRRYGYEVLTACNGQEAMQVLDEHRQRISLMLLDLTMPVMGGGDVLRLVRQQQPDLPVILCSGHAEAEARQSFGAAAEFLQKPFRSTDLALKVRQVLGAAAPAVS
jgi:CheY-like chemotaxis protein